MSVDVPTLAPVPLPAPGSLTIPVPDLALLPISLAAALLAMLVAAAVGHGVLRPLLEARGVTPWTVRDSVGSLMLVLVGAALATGGFTHHIARHAVNGNGMEAIDVLCLALLAAGALMMRLGLLALRKLT